MDRWPDSIDQRGPRLTRSAHCKRCFGTRQNCECSQTVPMISIEHKLNLLPPVLFLLRSGGRACFSSRGLSAHEAWPKTCAVSSLALKLSSNKGALLLEARSLLGWRPSQLGWRPSLLVSIDWAFPSRFSAMNSTYSSTEAAMAATPLPGAPRGAVRRMTAEAPHRGDSLVVLFVKSLV